MTRSYSSLVAGALAFVALTGCATAPSSSSEKEDLQKSAQATLDTARKQDASIGAILDKSVGVAVFPSVGKGAVGVGGAYGRGILFEGGAMTGYCDLSQATIGIQLGGQTYAEIIAFEDKAAVERFKKNEVAFSGQASAVAVKSGAGANAKYNHGVAVFTMSESGLMYEASLGGQKFSYQAK